MILEDSLDRLVKNKKITKLKSNTIKATDKFKTLKKLKKG